MPFQPAALQAIANEVGDNTLTKISDRTGLNPGHLSYILRGRRQPTLATAEIFAAAYNQPIDYFVGAEAA